MSFDQLVDGLNQTVRDSFGGVATVTVGGVSVDVQAIFDRTHREVDPDTGVTISTEDPRVGLRTADLPFELDTADDTRVVVGGQAWRVVDLQPDGQGMVVARLHEELE